MMMIYIHISFVCVVDRQDSEDTLSDKHLPKQMQSKVPANHRDDIYLQNLVYTIDSDDHQNR